MPSFFFFFLLIGLGVGHGTLKRKADDAAPGLTSKTEPREGFDVRKCTCRLAGPSITADRGRWGFRGRLGKHRRSRCPQHLTWSFRYIGRYLPSSLPFCHGWSSDEEKGKRDRDMEHPRTTNDAYGIGTGRR